MVEIVSQHLIKVLMRGDLLLVRVKCPKGAVTKKEVIPLTKQMKCEIREEKPTVVVELQS